MWRMLNNISRVFRTHIYNPRPSAGVLVDEDQEHDHCGQGSHKSIHEHQHGTELNLDEQWDCHGNFYKENGNLNGGDDNDRQKGFHHEFWHLLQSSESVVQAVTLGPVFTWGLDRNNWKQKSSGLLYRILFALPSSTSPVTVQSVLPTSSEKRPGQTQPPQSDQLAIKDAAGAALDEQINASKSETLEVAIREFQKVCYEYSACTQSVLGLQAANGGDMPTAVEHLRRSCILGNLSACFNLGLCYETGSGVPQDKSKAIYFYQKAAKGGHKQAMYNLGLLCLQQSEDNKTETNENLNTNSVKKSGTKSGLSKEMGLDFLEEAARLGLPEAQIYLGLYLMEDCQQPVKAVSYFKAAADQNDSEAQYLLAMCYEQGLGVDTNECLAAKFYSLAANTGHNLAIYNLGVFYEEGLGGLPQNKANALEMYRKAAKMGSVEAEERLGELLGTDFSNSRCPKDTFKMKEEKSDREMTALTVFDPSEEQSLADTFESISAVEASGGENPFISLLSPSSSFPSLRSLSSCSVPMAHGVSSQMSSSHHPGLKLLVQDSGGSSNKVEKSEPSVGKVHFVLGLPPAAMTVDHDRDRSILYSSLSVSEADASLPMLHRSHPSSDFSMIGI